MPLRICFIVGEDHANRCGVKDYALRLATALEAHGVTATVAAAPNWTTRACVPFCNKLRRANYDIIHIQYPSIGFKWSVWPHIVGCIAAFRRSVVTLHEYSALPAAQRVSTHLFRITAAQVLLTTDFEAARYNRILGKWGGVQEIVPIGTAVPTHPTALRRHLRVVYFGQIRPSRGLEEFVELAKLSIQSFRPFNFLVVGSPPEKYAEYYQRLRGQAPLGVQWMINLPHDDIAQILASSLAAYLPFPDGASYRRGSMLASLANGLPVITRRGPATPPELLDAVMLASGPPEALGILDRLYALPECTQEMVLRGRRLVQGFSWEDIARRHSDIYAAMLAGRTPGRHAVGQASRA